MTSFPHIAEQRARTHSPALLTTESKPWFPFISNFLQDKFVASVAPSSSFVQQAICEQIDFDRTHSLVEFGPGDGSITKGLLSRMSTESRLVAIETNESFVSILRDTLSDKRLSVVQDNALHFSTIVHRREMVPQAVVSGVPLSLFTDDDVLSLMHSVCAAMDPYGVFILYQAWLPPFFNEQRCCQLLRQYFEIIDIKTVYMNLPPLKVIAARPRIRLAY